MIFNYEIDACINGRLLPDDEEVAIQHSGNGTNFHKNVTIEQQRKFKQWLKNRKPKQHAHHEVQLDLIFPEAAQYARA